MKHEITLEGLFLSSKGLVTVSAQQIVASVEGFVGDRHIGFTRKAGAREPEYPRGTELRNNRQWSAVSVAELQIIAELMGISTISPEWVGANLSFLEAITHFPKGSKLLCPNGVVLVVEEVNEPCTGPGGIISSHYPNKKINPRLFIEKAVGRRGLVGVVEKGGVISRGRVQVVPYEPKSIFSAK